MKAHDHFSWCSYLGFEFARKQHTSCRAAPSNRSTPLVDYFEGTKETGDIALGARHPLVANRTYSTELFGGTAVDLIRAHARQHGASPSGVPLFLFVSLSATHKPYLALPGQLQRAGLAHSPKYFKECPWTTGSPVKCRAHHRKGYEAMAVGVDDMLGALRRALTKDSMWEHTLMIFASDNGGPIGPQASNRPLRGGKDTNLEGGVRTLAALGGGWLPAGVRGRVSHAFMHEADWLATLARIAGANAVDERAAALGLPPIDGVDVSPSWWGLASTEAGRVHDVGVPRTLVLATRFGLPGTPFGGTSALLDVRPSEGDTPAAAYKLVRGVVCECPECRPCQLCNATDGGCVFDVLADPSERHDLASSRPELLAALRARLDAAVHTKFVDRDPINQECWEHPKDRPNHWMEVALARGAVMQPWLKVPTRRGAKPKILYPELGGLGK